MSPSVANSQLSRIIKVASKEANLTTAVDMASKGVGGLGKAYWSAAKALGGGSHVGGAGVTAGLLYGAYQTPRLMRAVRKHRDRAMAAQQQEYHPHPQYQPYRNSMVREASMIEVPAEAYKQAGLGEITPEELAELEEFADLLSKTADWKEVAKKYAPHATVMAAPVVGLGATHTLRKAHDKLTYRGDLRKIQEVYPDIAQHDKKHIDLAYQSLRRLNPKFARDPLVGGTLLRTVLRNREFDNPKGAPRMDLSMAKELANVREHEHPLAKAISQSVGDASRMQMERHKDDLKFRSGVDSDLAKSHSRFSPEEKDKLRQRARNRILR